MAKSYGRWKPCSGRPYMANIEWKKYNEELVVQGEFLLEFEWIRNG